MSSSIWTRCAGASSKRALRLEPWRVVEAQHQIATRKLVDSDAEQQLLEQLIDGVKPPPRAPAHLHYLLFTPFRYPPLRYGSRFGTRNEPGIWYGSETLRTAFAEVAYYRLLFLEGTSAELGLLETELTAFRAVVRTAAGIDLTRAPFNRYETVLASRSDYRETQALGGALRAAGVEAFRYRSARDVEAGVNVAVIAAAAFGRRAPRSFETWYCAAARESGVELVRRDFFERATHLFPREDFLVAGGLPAPA
ncbi:MAG: RES family NAD+ phosphorylase [Gemmatimonadota bacterium]